MTKHLVIGASGFLGSTVAKQLAEQGADLRVMVRSSSSLRALAGHDMEVVHGDVHDPKSVLAAMAGCDVVYYCVVDARPWLRDPSPMIATNVGALPAVIDCALTAEIKKFVFTSSVITLAIDPDKIVDETRYISAGDIKGAYAASRVEAEKLVLEAAEERGLPAVVMCVANTYGLGDLLPTPHGGMLFGATLGRIPFCVKGAAAEVVAVDDAARALILAGERGKPGSRYIVAERYLPLYDVLKIGAEVGGVAPPKLKVPRQVMHVAGWLGEQVARLRGSDVQLTRESARLMHAFTPLSHELAQRELGWQPRDTREAIREAAEDFLQRRKDRRRPDA